MAIKNVVRLIGNVGNDPILTELENGSKVVKFSIATNESYKNSEGKKVETTDWHNCEAWGKKAELINEIIKKGNEVSVSGKLKNNEYTKNDVTMKYTYVLIEEFHNHNRKSQE